MLKSILFLLVLISFITTPTRAYEAYSISSLNLTEEQEAAEAAAAEPEVYELCEIAADKAEKEYNIKTNLLQTIASAVDGTCQRQRALLQNQSRGGCRRAGVARPRHQKH